MMFTQFEIAEELAEMVRDEARKDGKCPNLNNGFVLPKEHPNDWEFQPSRSGPALSDDCWQEIRIIERRLKEKGFGLKN